MPNRWEIFFFSGLFRRSIKSALQCFLFFPSDVWHLIHAPFFPSLPFSSCMFSEKQVLYYNIQYPQEEDRRRKGLKGISHHLSVGAKKIHRIVFYPHPLLCHNSPRGFVRHSSFLPCLGRLPIKIHPQQGEKKRRRQASALKAPPSPPSVHRW